MACKKDALIVKIIVQKSMERQEEYSDIFALNAVKLSHQKDAQIDY